MVRSVHGGLLAGLQAGAPTAFAFACFTLVVARTYLVQEQQPVPVDGGTPSAQASNINAQAPIAAQSSSSSAEYTSSPGAGARQGDNSALDSAVYHSSTVAGSGFPAQHSSIAIPTAVHSSNPYVSAGLASVHPGSPPPSAMNIKSYSGGSGLDADGTAQHFEGRQEKAMVDQNELSKLEMEV